MSNPRQRRSVFAAVSLGVLGIGCGTVDSMEEHPSEHCKHSPLMHSQSWGLKGVVRGTSHHDELLDVVVSGPSTVLVAGYEDGRDGLATVDPSGPATYGTILRYYDPDSTDTTVPLQRELGWFLGKDTTGTPNNTTEVIEAIALDPNSRTRLFFTGRTTGSFDKPNAGQFDTIAGWLPISAAGTFTTFQFGDERPQHPRRLDVKTDQVVIGGYNDYTVADGYVQAWEDPYLLKLTLERDWTTPLTLREATGPDWTAPMLGTAVTDTTLGLCVDKNDSSIYISGNRSAGSNRGMFVRKYTEGGSFVWEEKPSSISLDMAAAIVNHPSDSGIIFAGSTYANINGQIGDQDVVLMHLKSDKSVGWKYQDGSTGADWVTDMTVDAEGNIYVVGETLGSVDPAVENQGSFDIFVIKLSADRTQRQVFQMGSSGDDHPSAIAVDDATKKVYVVGYTTGNLGLPRDNPSNNHPTNPTDDPGNYGGRDSFLLQLTPPPMSPPGDVGI